jgi:hypothetical protein
MTTGLSLTCVGDRAPELGLVERASNTARSQNRALQPHVTSRLDPPVNTQSPPSPARPRHPGSLPPLPCAQIPRHVLTAPLITSPSGATLPLSYSRVLGPPSHLAHLPPPKSLSPNVAAPSLSQVHMEAALCMNLLADRRKRRRVLRRLPRLEEADFVRYRQILSEAWNGQYEGDQSLALLPHGEVQVLEFAADDLVCLQPYEPKQPYEPYQLVVQTVEKYLHVVKVCYVALIFMTHFHAKQH